MNMALGTYIRARSGNPCTWQDDTRSCRSMPMSHLEACLHLPCLHLPCLGKAPRSAREGVGTASTAGSSSSRRTSCSGQQGQGSPPPPLAGQSGVHQLVHCIVQESRHAPRCGPRHGHRRAPGCGSDCTPVCTPWEHLEELQQCGLSILQVLGASLLQRGSTQRCESAAERRGPGLRTIHSRGCGG